MSDIFLAGQALTADTLNAFVQGGVAQAEFVNQNAITITGIPFVAPFAAVPVITALVVAPTVGSASFALRAGDVTTTEFSIRLTRADSTTNLTTTYDLHWIAIGRPA